MGKGERSSAETKAHNIGSRQEENRGGAAGEVGEGEGGQEEVGIRAAEPVTSTGDRVCDGGFERFKPL